MISETYPEKVDPFSIDEVSARTIEEIRAEGLSRERLEEYFDICFPIVYGRCANCQKDDSACRVIHVSEAGASSNAILCDDCFVTVRDAFTAIVADDFDSLAQSLQRFNVQGAMDVLRAVN